MNTFIWLEIIALCPIQVAKTENSSQQYYEDKRYHLPPEAHLRTYGAVRRTIGNHVREVAMTIMAFRTLSDSSLSGMLLTGSTTR